MFTMWRSADLLLPGGETPAFVEDYFRKKMGFDVSYTVHEAELLVYTDGPLRIASTGIAYAHVLSSTS
jgi:hypothetical protein